MTEYLNGQDMKDSGRGFLYITIPVTPKISLTPSKYTKQNTTMFCFSDWRL
jgi:hypothetical protein